MTYYGLTGTEEYQDDSPGTDWLPPQEAFDAFYGEDE